MMSLELLKERNKVFRKGLSSLEEALKLPESEIVRDACIQRFEYCFEMGWKLLKRMIEFENGAPVAGGITSCIKKAVELRIIDREDLWLDAQRGRNLTSHTYDEAIANELYRNIQNYYKTFISLSDFIEKHY